ncbi:unnamed protein product, partial [Discosporangium mesarthrocarpum]
GVDRHGLSSSGPVKVRRDPLSLSPSLSPSPSLNPSLSSSLSSPPAGTLVGDKVPGLGSGSGKELGQGLWESMEVEEGRSAMESCSPAAAVTAAAAAAKGRKLVAPKGRKAMITKPLGPSEAGSGDKGKSSISCDDVPCALLPKLKVAELRERLSSRGVSLTGLRRKADLVKKLQESLQLAVEAETAGGGEGAQEHPVAGGALQKASEPPSPRTPAQSVHPSASGSTTGVAVGGAGEGAGAGLGTG